MGRCLGRAAEILAMAALLAAAASGQGAAEEAGIAATLMRQMSAKVLAEMSPDRPGFVPHHTRHTHDHDPAYGMAFLYKTPLSAE
jgi:hypothetical protein